MSRLSLFAVTLIFFTSGCQQQDRELLMRVGKRTAGKIHGLTSESGSKLFSGWVSSGERELTLESKVQSRLSWDKSLTDAIIQARGQAGVVVLTGTVKDLQQRRRAVELAESTQGCERVIDELVVPVSEP